MSTWNSAPSSLLPRPDARTELIKSFSLLKRNALAAPFERAFAVQRQLEANPPAADSPPQKEELMAINYR